MPPQRSDTAVLVGKNTYGQKNTFVVEKKRSAMPSAVVHCSRLCTPPTETASCRGGQPAMIPRSITDKPLFCRFSREFTMWKSCAWMRDRSMGTQRTQMDTRTANRGYFPKPQMYKRPVYDSIDRNVTIALQRMNSPRTAQVVRSDGSGLEDTKTRSRRIGMDVPRWFGAVQETSMTPGYCITWFGTAR